MGVPVITVDMAFGSSPGAASFTWTNIHTDGGTMRVRDMTFSRGRLNELNQIQAGIASLLLGDAVSDFDPGNAGTLVNLCTDPSFESGTAGWALSGSATIAQSAAIAQFGSKSLRVVATAAFGGAYLPAFIPVTPSTAYTLSVYVAPDAGGTPIRARWDEYTAGSVFVATRQVTITPSVGWQRVSVTAATDPTTVFVQPVIDSPTAAQGFFIDGVQLEAGASASAYCDGDQPGCRWEGAPELSRSYRGGLFYPNVRPYVPVRAQATIGGVTYPLFQHYVERWPRTMRVASTWTERSVQTVDGFDWMANAGLASASYSQESTGTRFANVLNTIGWSSTLRTLGAGSATEQAVAFAATDATKALSHLLGVAQDENGLFFIDSGGKVVFVQRHDLISTSPYTTSQATFHDAVAGGAGFSFVDVQPVYDLDTTFNVWSVTRTGGTAQVASDAPSQVLYGLRSQQLSSMVATDGDALGQAQWKLNQFKLPLNRIDSVTVMPGNDTAFWQAVLPLEVGMRITIREQPPGFASVKQADYLIQKIDAHFPAGTPAQATFTYGLWPADLLSYWRAGVPGFSEAGTTTRAVY